MDHTITLNRNGATRTIPVGFSWTTLFFAIAPSIIRNHWSFVWYWCFANFLSILAVLACVNLAEAYPEAASNFSILSVFALFFGHVWCAVYRNEMLLKHLIKDGWQLGFIQPVKVKAAVELNGESANQ
jgi:hypothetical protein